MLYNHHKAFVAVDSMELKGLLSAQPLRLETKPGIRTMSDHAKSAITVCGPTGKIMSTSPEFERHTGYTLAETIGKNPNFLQGQATSDGAIAQFRAILMSRKSGRVTVLNYKKSGEAFFYDVELTPIFDKKGQFACYTALQTIS